MFNFDMKIDQAFASFRDPETGKMVFVNSFDNHEFNVRFGTLEESIELDSIIADSDTALNEQLQDADFARYLALVPDVPAAPGDELPSNQ